MKRFFSLFLVFLILISVLSGCVGEDVDSNLSQPEIDDSSITISEDASSEEPSSSETSSEEDPPREATDFFSENGHEKLPSEADIPDYATETEIENLYSLDLDLPEADGYTIIPDKDILRLFYFKNDAVNVCTFISMETGETLCELTLPFWGENGSLSDGRMWVVEYPSLSVSFYDEKGNAEVIRQGEEADEPDGSDEVVEEHLPVASHVTPDGKYLAVAYQMGSTVEIYDLETGKMKVPDFTEDKLYWQFQQVGSDIVFTDDIGMWTFYNPETEEVKHVSAEYPKSRFHENLCGYYHDEVILLGPADGRAEYFYMPLEPNCYAADIAYGYAAVLDPTINTLSFYDLRTATCMSSVVLHQESNGYGMHTDILDSGLVLIFVYTRDGIVPYLYDLPAATAEYDGEINEPIICTKADMEAEISQISKDIYDETGIELYYGSAGNDFISLSYVAVAELDTFKIYDYVKELEEVMRLYPEGMLREVHEDTHKGLKIYLSGDIYGITGDGLDTAGGLTFDSEGYIVIVLDVAGNVNYDLPHELSHAFDRRIADAFVFDDPDAKDWMAFWDGFTPEYASYSNDYANYYDYDDYTADDANNDEVWFINSYARISPTEDRACIMEQLFNRDENGELTYYFKHENILNKARLYSYILRQCFPSCDTEETHFWEIGLGEIEIPE